MTATATKPTATFKRTRHGDWVVLADADYLHHCVDNHLDARVTKRDGTRKLVPLRGVGRSFDRDGQTMAYGYIDATRPVRNELGPNPDTAGQQF